MTTTETNLSAWIDHNLVDDGGAKIGKITEVYVDDNSGEPAWLSVATGMFGKNVNFVPLPGLTSDGEQLVSPWNKDYIQGAPNADPDAHLSEEEVAALYEYYGVGQNTPTGGDGGQQTELSDTTDAALGGDADAGQDTSGPNTDDAMTRSEEELSVGTEQRQAGKVKLKKWIETEHKTVTVPVRTEKARVVREGITDANVDDALSGADLSEEEHEIVLTEEEVVVDKKVVAKERVRLEKDVEVEQRQVEADVRKEQIELDDQAQSTKS